MPRGEAFRIARKRAGIKQLSNHETIARMISSGVASLYLPAANSRFERLICATMRFRSRSAKRRRTISTNCSCSAGCSVPTASRTSLNCVPLFTMALILPGFQNQTTGEQLHFHLVADLAAVVGVLDVVHV